MDFDWTDDLVEFREQVRAFARQCKATETPGLSVDAAMADASGSVRARSQPILEELDRRGWLRISWPESLGGRGKSPWYQLLLAWELGYHEVDHNRFSTASIIVPSIQKFGTDEQQRELPPKIWSGEITCAIGYSEPDAGSDLASLRTRAVRDGEQFTIQGSKIWTSSAHVTSHVWLACRTDPSAPKHRGISLFIVPLDTPGVTIRPIWVMAGHRTNQVFFDDVRVPDSALVGDENRGWYIMTHALDHERITMGVNNYIDVVHDFEYSMEYFRKDRPEILADPVARAKLAELKLDLHMLRALVLRSGWMIADGQGATKEASMGKVWATELRYRMTNLVMDLLGSAGVQHGDSSETAVDGKIEQAYLGTPVQRFAGGTNEIQRTIIAERGLGLPRWG
jgi:alkylation response protein AidB-like acyl-CoA dehydrogenase